MSEMRDNVTDFCGINGTCRCLLKPEEDHMTFLPWIYLTLAILGFMVNGLVMLDLWHSEKTPTIIFTLNIVVSDLLVCCSFPFRTAYYFSYKTWKADSAVCLTTEIVMISCFYINLYCNMCFLLWTSINRYATVVQPRWGIFQAFRQPQLCWVICVVTWILGIVIVSVSEGYEAHLISTQGMNSCFDRGVNKQLEHLNTFHGIGIGMFFFIFGLMILSYGLLIFHLQKVREGSMIGMGFGPGGGLKVRRKILASVVLFVACFLPYHLQRIRIMATQESKDCQKKQNDLNVKTLTIAVAALSCCLHPMLHLVLRLPCCRVKSNARAYPKPEITRSQITPNIQANDLPQNTSNVKSQHKLSVTKKTSNQFADTD